MLLIIFNYSEMSYLKEVYSGVLGIATEAQFTNGVPVREVYAVQGFPYVDTIPLYFVQ